MKIAIDFRDGHYTMYDPTKSTFADGVDPEAWMKANTLNIPDSFWRRYQEFLEHELWWQKLIQAYDTMIQERKERERSD